MRKRTISICCFLFILMFSACTRPKTTGPEISFDTHWYNFGQVDEGEDVWYSFSFFNAGTKILIIHDLIFSCWCVELEKADKIIRPGGEGRISIVVRTFGFNGNIIKTIKIKTNVPDKKIVLTIEGKVKGRKNNQPVEK